MFRQTIDIRHGTYLMCLISMGKLAMSVKYAAHKYNSLFGTVCTLLSSRIKVKRGNSGHGLILVSLYKSHRQLYMIDSLGIPLMLQ